MGQVNLNAGNTEVKRLTVALHDLCQPLTTLQCRLEMAQIVNTEAEYRQAVELALRECERLFGYVAEMREAVRLLAAGENAPGELI